VDWTVVGLGTETPGGSGRWQEQGLCAQTDPEAWFPERGEPSRAAKAVCLRCPVRTDCLDAALERDELFGIWGGLSRQERAAIKRRGAGRAGVA
jgi:WhiB family redox-sensing transcriptional regulator